ncbi:MAG TPA: hypothetical protein DHU75_07610 [Rikenellaceae bacterium]|nr:hypothetical protein [Rikenellaceae bacterium]
MLNRRILRIKVFKTIYARAENPLMALVQAKEQFEEQCQSTRNLYLFMLALIPALTKEANARIEAAKTKFHPTEEERNPNMKFAHNAVATLLSEDPEFNKIISKKKLSWEEYDAFLWHLYSTIREREYFKFYLQESSSSIQEDARLWIKIFEEELVDNAELEDILESMSIWWNNDLAYSLTCCCHTMTDFADGKRWSLPELYLSQMPGQENKSSDRDFAYTLLERSFVDYEKDVERIAELTPKWDIKRVCVTDLALIVCGMSEAAAFPLQPKKVIVNEYVEISKYFSTPESKAFVNGLLDKLIN